MASISADNEKDLTSGNTAYSYIFQAVYGVGIDGAGIVFYAEVFPNHIRAKGVALAMATICLADLAYLQVTATAFANIRWKFFLVILSRNNIHFHLWVVRTSGTCELMRGYF